MKLPLRLSRGVSLTLMTLSLGIAQSTIAQTFTVGATETDISQFKGDETDPTVAINPLNPSNMVIISTTDAGTGGLVVATSANLGQLWTLGSSNVIANGSDSLVPAYGEASAAFDAWGNLFVAYLPNTFQGVAVIVSTNGGQTFKPLTNLVAADATDMPRITSPARGAGAGSVWIVYKDYTLSGFPLVAQGLQTTGLGQVGSFGVAEPIPNSGNGGFPDISVGPAGQVLVAFQDNITNSSPAHIFTSVNTNAFGPGNFGPLVTATANAAGGFTYIPADNTGIGVSATPGVAWDTDPFSDFSGRAYLVYAGRASAKAPLNIYFRTSTNSGASWGSQIQVNDDNSGNDHFFPRIAVDPITGIVAATWYDCRNDQGANSEQVTNVSQTQVSLSGVTVSNVTVTPSQGVTASVTNDSAMTMFTVTVTGQNMTNFMLYNLTNLNSLSGAGGTGTASFDNGGVSLTVVAGTNGNGATIMLIETNIYPNAFTTGGASDVAMIPYGSASFNGGGSFLGNQSMVTLPPKALAFNGPATGFITVASQSASTTGFGHYSGLAFFGGNFFPAWTDNSDVPTNNPNGPNTNFDIMATTVVVPTAEISVFVTNTPNPVLSAGVLTYTIVVSNAGPKIASPVSLTNVIAPGLNFEGAFPSLGATYKVNGATVIFSIPTIPVGAVVTNILRVTATGSTYATNITTVGSPLTDPVRTNNTYTLATLIAGEDLGLGLAESETNSFVGDTISYIITVTNFGPSMNGDVIITNILSGNAAPVSVGLNPGATFTNYGNTLVFNLGQLATNQSTFVLVDATSLVAGTTITSFAAVSTADIDTNLLNNAAQVTATVTGEDLALGMTSSPTTGETGVPITYSLTVTNFGPSTNEDVIISNKLSANLTSVNLTAAPAGSLYFITNNLLVVDLGPLGLDKSTTMAFTAVPTNAGFATNIAIAGTSFFDTNFFNNSATAINVVTQAPPMIYGLVAMPTPGSALIVWQTDFPGTSQVAYGTTKNYGSVSWLNPALTNYHAVLLGGLVPGSNYFFNVMSTVNGVLYTSNGTFTTTTSLILNTQDASYTGFWTRGQQVPGIFGAYYQYTATTNGDATATATYRPLIPTSGNYDVSIWYPQDPSFSTNTQVFITGGTNEIFVPLNQTTNGGHWLTLAANFYMAAGASNTLVIENNTGESSKSVVANAVQWSFDAGQDVVTNGVLPAWWADFFFGTPNVSASADPDGDGYSNYAEYVFGTSPNDPSSHLSFSVTPSGTNNVAVTFSPWIGGRVYQLQTATDLGSKNWVTLTNTPTVNTNGQGVFVVPQAAGGSSFYRLNAHF